ncbi:MAG: metallophosphoesterase family protein [Proteobacteria bacterium]|nr:metallophosphoesterase family protein [Pseudomonadota bacterium]
MLVFGGPYGNREATETLIEEAERRGVPPARMICTGDVAAYCADPQAVADLLRRLGVPVVRGNCDEALGLGAESCDCGFAEGTACDLLARRWYAYSAAALDAAAKAWMRALPNAIRFEMAGRRLHVAHGTPSRANAFVFASTPAAEKEAEVARADADAVIAGHAGIPFTQVLGSRLWHNAGAIGMPANDGTPRVWFSFFVPEGGHIRIEHRALGYDHTGAAAKMRAAGLSEGYAAALESGLWPSLDVLPPAERAGQGQALAFAPLLWPAAPEPGRAPRPNAPAASAP